MKGIHERLADAWTDAYDKGFTAGANMHQMLTQYVVENSGFSNESLEYVTNELQKLEAERDGLRDQVLQLQAELTQLRSQAIAREDRPEPEAKPLSDGWIKLGTKDLIQEGDKIFFGNTELKVLNEWAGLEAGTANIWRHESMVAVKPAQDPLAELLKELTKTHYQLGDEDRLAHGDIYIHNGVKHEVVVSGASVRNVGYVFRPIPTNIPLPSGATIPDGYCALAKGEVVPEGSKLWASRYGEKVDWVKSNFEGLDQNTSFYYIRPQEGVNNG